MAQRLYGRWITGRARFGWALIRALGASMLLPTVMGLLAALAAPATAALLETVVRRVGNGAVPGGLTLGLVAAVLAHRAATWSVTVLLRRRCELAGSAVARCLARRAMATPTLDPQFSTNLVTARYPEILAQYVFVATLPGNVLAVAALLVVAVLTAGPAAAAAAVVGVVVVLALGYGLNARESRAAYAVERGEAHRTRLMATVLTRRPTLVRQSLGRQVTAAFDTTRTPQVHTLRRRARAAALASGLWGNYELLALLAALGGLAAIGRLEQLGPALALLVVVRLIGAEVTDAANVVSCLQDARPVLRSLRTDWFDATTPSASIDLVALTRTPNPDEGPAAQPVMLPARSRALVVGDGPIDPSAVLRRLAATPVASPAATGPVPTPTGTTGPTTLLVARDRPLLPGTVRGAITLTTSTDAAEAVDEQRYAQAITASGLAPALAGWNDGDARRVGVDDGLSDGERVRLQLAQALYWRPEVLVVDDALAALDPATATAVAAAVFSPATNAPALVLFTTTRAELAAYADHLVVLTDPTGDTRGGGQPGPLACGARIVPADQATAGDLPADATAGATGDTADVNDLLAHLRAPSPATGTPTGTPPGAAVDEAPTRPAADGAGAPGGGAADLSYSPPRLASMLRHALGLYGPVTTGVVALAATVSVAAVVAAAQIADTEPGTGVLVPLALVAALGLAATGLVYGLSGLRAVDRMTALQRQVLSALLRPGPAREVPLARLTTDVHTAEFRASDRLQGNVLGVGAAAAFVVVAAVTAPVTLAGLVPALVVIAVVVRRARASRARAQRLAVAAREPLLVFSEAALATAPTFAHPGARAALAAWFDELSDTAFWAGRRSLDIRARLLAAVEAVAAAVFVLTAVAVLADAVTTTGVSAATLLYLAYTVTGALAGVVERLQQADALHATLSRVASLTGDTELTIHPDPGAPSAVRCWPSTDAIRVQDRLVVPTTPALVLSVGAPVAMTGPSGAGKSVLLRAASTLSTDPGQAHSEAHSVALLEADVPPLGLTLAAFLDPDRTHAPDVVARAWHEVHPPGRTPPPLTDPVDELARDERQRANLTRAHLERPDLLLLDEALCALDPAGERRMIETLSETFPATAVLVVLHRHANLDLFHHEIAVPADNEHARDISSAPGAGAPSSPADLVPEAPQLRS